MKRLTINIATYDYTASAVVRLPRAAWSTATPGLAVRKVSGAWQIDHIASGKRLPGLNRSRADAAARAARLGLLGDWTPEDPGIRPCERCEVLTFGRQPCQRCEPLGMLVSLGSPPARAVGPA